MIAIAQDNKKPKIGIKKQWTGQRLLAFPSPRARIFPFVSKNQRKIIELDSLAGRLTRSGEKDIAHACLYPAIFGIGSRKLHLG